MKIHSLTKILAMPLVVAFAVILYISAEQRDYALSYWLIPIAIALAVLYVMHPQIDFLWHKRQPPTLGRPIVWWLDKYSAFYNGLSILEKERFRDRLSLFVESKSFTSIGADKESVPEDIKAILAHNAVQVTFGLEKFLMKKFDRFALYKHAFPSPEFPFLHTVETHAEDGVIIYSLEHLLPGMMRSYSFYNIGIHACAEALLKGLPHMPFQVPEAFRDQIPAIVKFDMAHIHHVTGFETLADEPIAVTLFFTNPEGFQSKLPELYDSISQWLQQDLARSA